MPFKPNKFTCIVFFSDGGNYKYYTNNPTSGQKSLVNYLLTLDRKPLFMDIYIKETRVFERRYFIASEAEIKNIQKQYTKKH